MKKKKHIVNAVGVVAIAGLSALGLYSQAPSQRGLYPDPKITPGMVDTTSRADIVQTYKGKTYSQNHRNVTEVVKKAVYAEYKVSYPQADGAYEVDHFIPLALGGSNNIANLWLEPAHLSWHGSDLGFHTKDFLENYMVAQVKNNKVSLSEAQNCFRIDWVACYTMYIQFQVKGVETNTPYE